MCFINFILSTYSWGIEAYLGIMTRMSNSFLSIAIGREPATSARPPVLAKEQLPKKPAKHGLFCSPPLIRVFILKKAVYTYIIKIIENILTQILSYFNLSGKDFGFQNLNGAIP